MTHVIRIIAGVLLGVIGAGLEMKISDGARYAVPGAVLHSGLILTVVLTAMLSFEPVPRPFRPFFAGATWGQILGLSCRYPWDTLALAVTVSLTLFVFIEIRHTSLRRRRQRHPLTAQPRRRSGEKALYVLAVLGSGGHTKEMLLMMGNDFLEPCDSHRRYLITKGDDISFKQAGAFEESLRETGDDPGTYDVRVATRARRVHQSLLTTPISALRSVIDILPILLTRPGQISPGSPLNLPDVIFTNGPATGFFVALVAHLLKIFYFVPENKMQVLFIESWARVSSLSLTGKLFYYTGIADMFLVQHESVANIYGVLNAGWLVLAPSQRRGNVQ